MKQPKYFIAFLVLFLTKGLYSQLPDSVLANIKQLDDTAKIAYLITYAQKIYYQQPDLAISLAMKAIQKADSTGNFKQKAQACYILSDFYLHKSMHSQALDYALKAMPVFENIKDTSGIINCLKSIGIIYIYENNTTKGTEYFKKALEIAKLYKDYSLIGSCYNNLGVIYAQTGNFEESLKYHKLSLENCRQAGDIAGMAKSYLNIGVLFRNLNKPETSNEYLKKSLPVFEKNKFYRGLASAYNNIGINYTTTGQYQLAEQMLLKSLEIARNIDDKEMLANAYFGFTALYEKMNNYQLALKYYKILEDIEDSVLNAQRSEQIAEMHARFDAEKKDNEIKNLLKEREIQILTLHNQKLTLTIIGFLGIAAIIIFILLYRYRIFKEKQLRKLAILETEHNERLRIAKDMHDELGSGLSKVLIQSELLASKMISETDKHQVARITASLREISGKMSDLVWSLHTENCTLENLIARLREYAFDYFEDNTVDLQAEFPEIVPEIKISKNIVRNAFLSYKEALNNTLKHSEATTIKIAVKTDQSDIYILIADNGKGFNPENKSLYGNGLNNMKNRIESTGGIFSIESQPGQGTKIMFRYNLSQITDNT